MDVTPEESQRQAEALKRHRRALYTRQITHKTYRALMLADGLLCELVNGQEIHPVRI